MMYSGWCWRVMRLAGAGVAAGLPPSLALTRLMRTLLYGVDPTDTWTLVAISVLLIGITILAVYLPARRARVDPLEALRYELTPGSRGARSQQA